jgi:hypothetical protein
MTTRATAVGSRPTIANLYELWTLDIIPCLGQPCATLCRDYPHEFKTVPDPTLDTLADLLYRTGYDSKYLDEQGRKALLMPVLGDSDGAMGGERSGAFHQSADALRCRAKDFVHRVFTTGEDQLREAFRDAATSFQNYLTAVDGTVVFNADKRLTVHFNEVVSVLQEPQFANGLGLPSAPASPPAPGVGWPLGGTPLSGMPINKNWHGDGAMLVYAVTKRAQASAGTPVVTDVQFLQMQRIATYGAHTIEAVLNVPTIWTDNLITNEAISLAYRWWTSIAELTGESVTPIR